jgi:hypothetical protein
MRARKASAGAAARGGTVAQAASDKAARRAGKRLIDSV